MRLLGLDIRRAQRALALATATAPVVAKSSSRRSYDDPLGLGPNKVLEAGVSLELYDVIVKAMPFIDRALRMFSRMIVPFEVECENQTTQDALEDWLATCRIGYLFRGFNAFARPYIRQVLQYGKSAGEVVLAASKRDVETLHVISSKKVRLLKDAQAGLVLGQDMGLGKIEAFENQELFTYSALNTEGDNPHGVSLLRSIPFVADIELRMENALRQMWQRHGAPSFFIHVQTKPDVTITDDRVKEIQSEVEDAWHNSQQARWNQEGIMDFVAATQMDMTFQAIGGDVKELSFEVPHRALQEQIISSVELAPFMLGIQWSTTERLSQQQADAIIGSVQDIRAELAPDFLHILDWVQRTRGLRGKVALKWADVNLQDMHDTAMADFWGARAVTSRIQNALTGWLNGWWDQERAREIAGYEFEEPLTQALDVPIMPGKQQDETLEQLAQAQYRSYP